MKKEEKIRKLFNKGITDPATIARKLGVKGNAISPMIVYIKEVLALKTQK